MGHKSHVQSDFPRFLTRKWPSISFIFNVSCKTDGRLGSDHLGLHKLLFVPSSCLDERLSFGPTLVLFCSGSLSLHISCHLLQHNSLTHSDVMSVCRAAPASFPSVLWLRLLFVCLWTWGLMSGYSADLMLLSPAWDTLLSCHAVSSLACMTCRNSLENIWIN